MEDSKAVLSIIDNLRGSVEEAILHYGMTSGQFASACGVSQSMVSKIINGGREYINTRHLKMMLPWLLKEAPRAGEAQ